MQLIKTLATDSTNSAVRELYRENPSRPNLAYRADFQRNGRGQRGNVWQSEAGKNLTFSLLLNRLKIPVSQRFKLSMLTSIAIIEKLRQYGLQNLFIKWPNDILSGKRKIAGILIETLLSGSTIKAGIIGIGLNVNQKKFEQQAKASSLSLEEGHGFNLDELFYDLVLHIEQKLLQNITKDFNFIEKEYYHSLKGYKKSMQFEFPEGNRARGEIQSVKPTGELQIDFQGKEKEFGIKEIKMVY